MKSVLRIERKTPALGGPEKPHLTPKGYKMADPRFGAELHHAEHAQYRDSLDKVAVELSRGWKLWMKQDGKRETLICRDSLNITYA